MGKFKTSRLTGSMSNRSSAHLCDPPASTQRSKRTTDIARFRNTLAHQIHGTCIVHFIRQRNGCMKIMSMRPSKRKIIPDILRVHRDMVYLRARGDRFASRTISFRLKANERYISTTELDRRYCDNSLYVVALLVSKLCTGDSTRLHNLMHIFQHYRHKTLFTQTRSQL